MSSDSASATREGPGSGDVEAGPAGSSGKAESLTRDEAPAYKGRGSFGERPEVFRNTLQEVLFVFQATAAMMTNSFLSGTSMIVTAYIGRDLGMTQGEITWIGASTSLTAGAFQLALGQLADLLGRKMTFLLGMASFAAFCVLAGFAQNPLWMDVTSGILGLCTALVVPPAIGILGAAYPRPSRRKNLAFSAFSAGNPLGFVLGSLLCGVAARLASWRAAYFLIAVLWAVFAVVATWAVPKVETFARHETLAVRLWGFVRRFDWVGAVLTLFGTGMFSASITLGPADGWGAPHVVAMLVAGVLLLVMFGFWERVYPNPLMPPHIWRDRNFTLISVVVALGFMSFVSSSFWLAFFMQELLHMEPLIVALHLLPMAIAGLIWNVVAGAILHRVNNTLILILASLCYVVSNVLLAVMKADSVYWAFVFPYLVLSVVGADFQFNVANMYVMQSLPSHQQSLAGGIFNTLIRLSTTVSMGITTAVFSSVAATPAGVADPMLKFTRAWQACVAMSGASLFFLPLIRLGTQGHTTTDEKAGDATAGTGRSVSADIKEKK